MIKRSFDIVISTMTIFLLFPILIIVAVLIKFTSSGGVLYWSDRVGVNNKLFCMPKFRTMKTSTPVVASHELKNPEAMLTPIGNFLRKSSIDEIPQLWSIIKGDMSIVGPRPALHSQDDLIALRTESGVNKIKPGLTGWAQVNGRDELPIHQKVLLDVEYTRKKSLSFDVKIIGLTVIKVLRQDSVSH